MSKTNHFLGPLTWPYLEAFRDPKVSIMRQTNHLMNALGTIQSNQLASYAAHRFLSSTNNFLIIVMSSSNFYNLRKNKTMYVQGDFKKVYFYSKKMSISRCVFGKFLFLFKNGILFYSVSQKKSTFFFKKNTFKTSFAE